jgi:hypothetical protein
VVDVLKYQHAALSQNLYQYKRRIAALEASTGELSSSNAALYAALAEADARVAMVRKALREESDLGGGALFEVFDGLSGALQREGRTDEFEALLREAEALQLKAHRDAELANMRAELEAKQAAAKAAREAQLSAEKVAREAEIAANQAKREAGSAAINARKEEKRLARTAALALPVNPPVSPSVAPAVTPVPPAVALSSISAPDAAAFEPAVRAWLKAWGDRRVDDYLAFYAPSFEVPGVEDRTGWAAHRRDSMTRPAWIKVRADHLKTSVNGDTAETRFFQVYVVAPGTVELLKKTMRWVWTDGRWQIVQEQSEPLVGKHAKK